MHLNIRQYGDPILKELGVLVVNFDDELKQFADDLITTLRKVNAVGLAAQHVGQALQLCVIDVLDSSKKSREKLIPILDGKEVPLNFLMPLIIINPELMPVGSKEVTQIEGSISLPGIEVPIRRHELIHIKFQDVQGVWHELKCGGILARCILHEYDQAQGIFFIERAQRRDLMPFEAKLKKLQRASQDLGTEKTKN